MFGRQAQRGRRQRGHRHGWRRFSRSFAAGGCFWSRMNRRSGRKFGRRQGQTARGRSGGRQLAGRAEHGFRAAHLAGRAGGFFLRFGIGSGRADGKRRGRRGRINNFGRSHRRSARRGGRHFFAVPTLARRNGRCRQRSRNRLLRALSRRRGLRRNNGHNGHAGFVAVAGTYFIHTIIEQRHLAVQPGHAVLQSMQALLRFSQNPLICLAGGFHLLHLPGGRTAADRQNKAGCRNHKKFFHTALLPGFCPKPLWISRSLAAAAFFRQVQMYNAWGA